MRKTESKITGQTNVCFVKREYLLMILRENVWLDEIRLLSLPTYTCSFSPRPNIACFKSAWPLSLNTTFIRHSMYEYICNYVRYVCSVFIRSLNHMKNSIFILLAVYIIHTIDNLNCCYVFNLLWLSYAFWCIHFLFRIIFYPKYKLEQA